ncbi:MAG: baseplate J/gp47 family protein [Rhodoblastus sp.]
MSRFDQVDYSALPFPDAIETWSHQAILDARMQAYLAEWGAARALDPTLPAYDVAMMETDPAKRLQRVDAYRESLIRQRINEAVRATYLARALKSDLTDRAAEYLTARADGETDDSLRRRAQLAWENLSIGGSYGGYAYQALSVAPAEIADVAVLGYEARESAIYGVKALTDMRKGEVRLALLGAGASGAASGSLIARVQAYCANRSRRKVNDLVNVVQASLQPYVVQGTLVIKRGAPPSAVIDAARSRAAAYGAATRTIGVEATRGGYFAALMADQPGLVVDVDLIAPAATVGGGPMEAPILTGVDLAWRYAA